MYIIFHLSITEIFAEEYITRINNGSGLYFDPLGNVKISKEPLFIGTAVDISKLKIQLEMMTDAFKVAKISSLQIEIFDSGSSFTKTVKSIEDLLNVCQDQYNNLYRKRSKRCNGWSNFFSQCSTKKDIRRLKELYEKMESTMNYKSQINDQKFMVIGAKMKYMAADITNLKQTQIEIQGDLKDVRRIIEEEQALSLEARNKIKEQGKHLEDVDTKIEDIENVLMVYGAILKNHSNILSQHQTQINNLNIRSKMTSLLEDINKVLQLVSNRLRDITNSINFARTNILDTAIISHDTVLTELYNNIEKLPHNSELPYHLTPQNMHKLLEISMVGYQVMENIVMFILRIPLVSKSEFVAYDYWPMPIANDSANPQTFAFIQPNKRHSCLALSRDKISYTYIDSFKSCKSIDADKYICQSDRIFSTSEAQTCETQLLTGSMTTVPEECEVRAITGTVDIWHKLKNKQWIFVQSKLNRVTMECGDKTEEIPVIGSGVLTVPADCSAHTMSQQFVSDEESGTIMQPPITYVQLLSSDCCTVENLNKTMQDKKKAFVVASNMNSIVDDSHLLGSVGNASWYVYLYAFLGLLFLIVICFGFYKLYKYLKRDKNSSQDPEGQKRNRFSNRLSMNRFAEFFNKNSGQNQHEETTSGNKTQEIEESEGKKRIITTETQNKKISITKNVMQQSGGKTATSKTFKTNKDFSEIDLPKEFQLMLSGSDVQNQEIPAIKFDGSDSALTAFFQK